VASRKTLADSVIATGMPNRGRDGHERFLRECKVLMPQVAGIRRTGSAATDLSWVAAGRLDGYFDYHLGAWDIAAGAMLVREAGGHVSDSAGGNEMFDTKSIVAGNATIQKALLGVITDAQKAP
jgi:myo-inositol-1(or 4)-monophosphatase